MKRLLHIFYLSILVIAMTGFIGMPYHITKDLKDIKLKNVDNKFVSLSSYKNAKGFMIVFTCNKCPMAKFYSERLNKLNIQFAAKNVYLLAVNSMDRLYWHALSYHQRLKRY